MVAIIAETLREIAHRIPAAQISGFLGELCEKNGCFAPQVRMRRIEFLFPAGQKTRQKRRLHCSCVLHE
jgi:hypothetical protein